MRASSLASLAAVLHGDGGSAESPFMRLRSSLPRVPQ